MPLFLCSATFFPLSAYPDWAEAIVAATPLYQGVALERALFSGEVGPGLLVHVAYLVGMAVGVRRGRLAPAARRLVSALKRRRSGRRRHRRLVDGTRISDQARPCRLQQRPDVVDRASSARRPVEPHPQRDVDAAVVVEHRDGHRELVGLRSRGSTVAHPCSRTPSSSRRRPSTVAIELLGGRDQRGQRLEATRVVGVAEGQQNLAHGRQVQRDAARAAGGAAVRQVRRAVDQDQRLAAVARGEAGAAAGLVRQPAQLGLGQVEASLPEEHLASDASPVPRW